MKKPNIVFLDEYSMGGRDLGPLRRLGSYTGYPATAPAQTVERCRNADVVITNKVVFDAAILDRLPRLRLICVAATGMNNIDLAAAADRGVEVRNAAGYSTRSVTETTVGAAIALLRQSIYYDRYVKSGCYAASDKPFDFSRPTFQLAERRWGIVGMGQIGREVARIATALGCEVRYTSTSGVVRQEAYPAMPLEELLGWADVVSVHAPLNERTRGLIGGRELRMMKPTALLINVARGGIIDEEALARALDEGTIAGAAVDVFTREPIPADNPLLTVRDPDRLLLSPHNAWSPAEAIDRLIGLVAENIENFMEKDE